MESFAKKSEQSNGLIASAASSPKSSASASPAKAPSTQAAAAAAAPVQNPVPVSLVVSYYELHYYEFHEVGVWESGYLCACTYQSRIQFL